MVDVVHAEVDEFRVSQRGRDVDSRDVHLVTERAGLDVVSQDVLATALEEDAQRDVTIGEK